MQHTAKHLRRLRHTLDLATAAFLAKQFLAGKVFLIFSTIYQIVDQHIALWSLPTIPWIPMYLFLTCLASRFVSSLLDFTEIRRVLASPTSSTLKLLKIIIYIWSDHAETSLLDDCAWGTPGVQLLNWSDLGQVRAIRFRTVWVSWYPSI